MSPRHMATLVVVALLGTACSLVGEDQEADRASAPPTAPPAAAMDDPTDAPTATGGPPSDPRTLDACDPDDVALMDSAVDGQLAAFADEDYERALTFATDGFRRQFPPEQFKELITESFPAVTRGGEHASGACLTDGDNATLEVALPDADGLPVVLVYLMERDGEAWRIAGAVPEEAEPPQSA